MEKIDKTYCIEWQLISVISYFIFKSFLDLRAGKKRVINDPLGQSHRQ